MTWPKRREAELRQQVREHSPHLSESDVRWEAAYWLSVELESMLDTDPEVTSQYLAVLEGQKEWSKLFGIESGDNDAQPDCDG